MQLADKVGDRGKHSHDLAPFERSALRKQARNTPPAHRLKHQGRQLVADADNVEQTYEVRRLEATKRFEFAPDIVSVDTRSKHLERDRARRTRRKVNIRARTRTESSQQPVAGEGTARAFRRFRGRGGAHSPMIAGATFRGPPSTTSCGQPCPSSSWEQEVSSWGESPQPRARKTRGTCLDSKGGRHCRHGAKRQLRAVSRRPGFSAVNSR